MTKRLFIIMVAVSLLSCDREETSKVEILQIKEKAVDTLTIGSNSFILDAELWRDFMPISPPNGQPMVSINWLISVDSVKIPDNIRMIRQYVIYQDEIWVANYLNDERPPQPPYRIEKISKNGPKWGPHIYVDVISLIRDIQNSKDYYIQRRNVYVGRTD